MTKETLEKILFWVGIGIVLIPILALLSLPEQPGQGIDVFFMEDIDYIPYFILFAVGSSLIMFSIYNSKSPTIKKRSISTIIFGVLIWLFLIIDVFVADDWWWLTWTLLALIGVGFIFFGVRNIMEKQ